MTRRDLQNEMKKQGRPWSIGKAFEQSAPIGPIVPIATTGELTAGAITLDVNGVRKQTGDLKDLIWNVAETIEQLAAAWDLQAGDLIFTGTPAGVGAVVRGDVMEGHIAGLGTLRVEVRLSRGSDGALQLLPLVGLVPRAHRAGAEGPGLRLPRGAPAEERTHGRVLRRGVGRRAWCRC